MPPTTWAAVNTYIGRILSLVVAIIACILWAQGTLPKEWALATLAVCALGI